MDLLGKAVRITRIAGTTVSMSKNLSEFDVIGVYNRTKVAGHVTIKTKH